MLFNSYQVEIEDPVTGVWEVDQCFQPVFKWVFVPNRLLRFIPFLRRRKPIVMGDPEVVAVILKADAHHHARRLHRTQTNRHVRVTRIEHEGAERLKIVVWQDGEWY